MSEPAKRPPTGTFGWFDLTVDDAPRVRDFYREVVGWSPSEVAMGEYADYSMCRPDTLEPVAGVCHHRGSNVGIPPQWLIYVYVDDLDGSMARTTQHGGAVIYGPRDMGASGRFCVVRDPAGAVMGLFEAPR